MKKSVKIFSFILAAVMAVFCFGGCSGSSGSKDNSQKENSDTVSQSSQPSGSSAKAAAAEALGIDISKYEDLEAKADLNSGNSITLNGSTASCENNCAKISGGNITITKKGSYIISGTLNDGCITVNLTEDENVYLVLNGADITCSDGCAINIQSAKNAYVIAGTGTENTLTDGSAYSGLDESGEPDACLFSKDDLMVGGGGSLTVNANYKDGIKSKDDLIISGNKITVTAADDGIAGKDSVAVVKAERLTVSSQSDGIKSANTDGERGNIGIFSGNIEITALTDGIQAENSLYIEDGALTLNTGGGSANASQKSEGWGRWGGEQTEEADATSAKALKAGALICINGGSLVIDSSDDSVHSNGDVAVAGGSMEFASGDDGIHADGSLTVSGGTINITKSYEGLEGSLITLDGGDIKVSADDDGINAAGGDGSQSDRPGAGGFSSDTGEVVINGGSLYVSAGGDGLDSNGTMTVNGGAVIVNGPANDGNGAIDYEVSAEINGGVLIAVGMSGMAEQFGENSSQNNVMVNLTYTQTAGELINISDENGESLVTFAPEKSWNSVVYSSAQLEAGKSYTLSTGGSCTGESKNGLYSGGEYSGGEAQESFTVSSTVTTVGTAGGMGGGMPGGMGGGMPGGDMRGGMGGDPGKMR